MKQEPAPTRPTVRGFFGMGGRREALGTDETTRLVQGENSSGRGDLDNIFARMEDAKPQVRSVLQPKCLRVSQCRKATLLS